VFSSSMQDTGPVVGCCRGRLFFIEGEIGGLSVSSGF